MVSPKSTIDQLYEVIASRKDAPPGNSYTGKLYAEGRMKIAKKFGEEAIEVCLATVNEGRSRVISESCDLLYHLLVLWAERGILPNEVWDELTGRFGVSGMQEKASRPLK